MNAQHEILRANPTPVHVGVHQLPGLLGVPDRAHGLVIFAHGSGSGRLSPRNNHVADALRQAGLATLLLDLLTPDEERNRDNVFDIPLLAERLASATEWASQQKAVSHLLVGYFGASTGGGAALRAAAQQDGRIQAIVSRGGRPDLAGRDALERVKAPTLLIVGSRDTPVIALNEQAMRAMTCPVSLVLVHGASHLFEEPGTLDEVIVHARSWFRHYLDDHDRQEPRE